MNSPCSLPLGADHGLLRFAIAAGTGKLGFHAPAAAARAPNSKRPAAARWAPWAPPLRAATSALATGLHCWSARPQTSSQLCAGTADLGRRSLNPTRCRSAVRQTRSGGRWVPGAGRCRGEGTNSGQRPSLPTAWRQRLASKVAGQALVHLGSFITLAHMPPVPPAPPPPTG